jgi:hypothetical protein
LTPFDLTVNSDRIDSTDYSTKVTFDAPDFTTDPAECKGEATFTCEIHSTPAAYSGSTTDLCGTIENTNGAYSTRIKYTASTAKLEFETTDKAAFPPGVYKWKITITVGDESDFTYY